MKHTKIFYVLTLCVSANLLSEQRSGPAVVQYSRIMNENPETSGSLQFRDESKSLQEWASKEEAVLKKDQAKIEAYQTKLMEAEKAGKKPTETEIREYTTMAQGFQKRAQELQMQGQERFKAVYESIKAVVDECTLMVRKKHGFTYSVAKEMIIECDPSLDITEEVLKEMNSKYEAKKRAEKMKKEATKSKL